MNSKRVCRWFKVNKLELSLVLLIKVFPKAVLHSIQIFKQAEFVVLKILPGKIY